MPSRGHKQRLAAQRHYWSNRPAYLRRARNAKRELRKTIHEYTRNYKKANPCVHCGESDWKCLAFHHRDPSQKLFTIGEASSKCQSLSTLIAEIAKCDVVCHNCHARLTIDQEHWRAPLNSNEPDPLPLLESAVGQLQLRLRGAR